MLLADYDAVVLAGGAEAPRDLPIAGRDVPGIHFAMDFLTQQNKRVAGDSEDKAAPSGTITAKGKHVVVIGGGDTGSDCIGTSNRQGALSVTQLEILAKPPVKENKPLVWPDWPLKLRTSSSQEEGVARDWSVQTRRAIVEDGKLTGLECVRVEWKLGDGGKMNLVEVPRQRIHAPGRTGAAGDGLCRPAQGRAWWNRRGWRWMRAATSKPTR